MLFELSVVLLFAQPSPVSVVGTLGTELEFIEILPVAVIFPHPPVRVTVYPNVPEVGTGVPLIVTVLFPHEPVTPSGSPVNVALVAPVVAYVIFLIVAFTHDD